MTLHPRSDYREEAEMDPKVLRTVALVAGAFGVFVGLWGLIAPGEMQTPGEIQESIRWSAGGILAVALSAVSTALAGRGK